MRFNTPSYFTLSPALAFPSRKPKSTHPRLFHLLDPNQTIQLASILQTSVLEESSRRPHTQPVRLFRRRRRSNLLPWFLASHQLQTSRVRKQSSINFFSFVSSLEPNVESVIHLVRVRRSDPEYHVVCCVIEVYTPPTTVNENATSYLVCILYKRKIKGKEK